MDAKLIGETAIAYWSHIDQVYPWCHQFAHAMGYDSASGLCLYATYFTFNASWCGAYEATDIRVFTFSYDHLEGTAEVVASLLKEKDAKERAETAEIKEKQERQRIKMEYERIFKNP